MARPASRAETAPARFLELAIRMVADQCSGGPPEPGAWRFGPVVLVSPAADAASLAVRAALAARGVDPDAGPATWDGRALCRQIAAAVTDDRLDRLATALAACRVVVVDRIDRVTGSDRQQALVHLLDTSAAAGTAWCVSVARHPPAGFSPQCGSRLGGGLVVPVPTEPALDSGPPAAVPSVGRVIRATARHHDVLHSAIVGPARSRSVAVARSVAMYLARTLTGLSFQAIGAAFGGRDHTTVLHGVRVCAAKIARDHAFAAEVGRLAVQLSRAPEGGRSVERRRRSGVGSAAAARALGNRRRQRRRPA